MRIEIRCCCDAGKLIGYVDVDRRQVRAGESISFALRPTFSWKGGRRAAIDATAARVLLPIARASGLDSRTGEYFSRLAIKSMETPLATLRRIQGFTEVV